MEKEENREEVKGLFELAQRSGFTYSNIMLMLALEALKSVQVLRAHLCICVHK